MTNRYHPRSILGFCERLGICRSTFYNHKDKMPKRTKIGHRVLILEEHEREWVENGGPEHFVGTSTPTNEVA